MRWIWCVAATMLTAGCSTTEAEGPEAGEWRLALDERSHSETIVATFSVGSATIHQWALAPQEPVHRQTESVILGDCDSIWALTLDVGGEVDGPTAFNVPCNSNWELRVFGDDDIKLQRIG